MQAPAADIARYRGRYDNGFEALRAQRLKRQEELGLIAPGTVPHSLKLPQGGWDSLTAEGKRSAARDMEIYAAMVDRVDQNIGRVIETLRQTGELDNTVIVFLADNGAEAIDTETTGRQMLGRFVAQSDNSFANRGAATSYVTYGAGWAQAATAPSWTTKGYASEGGTRTVSFVNWQGLGRQRQIGNAYLNVADITPTVLDLAGVPHTGATFEGRRIRPISGKSWADYLKGTRERVYDAGDAIGTELFGSRAIRRGDWKITDIGEGKWRLFDLAKDPGETHDLSLQEPAKLAELVAEWDRYAQRVGVILPSAVAYRP